MEQQMPNTECIELNNRIICPISNQQIELMQVCGRLAHQDSILACPDGELRRLGFAGATTVPQLVFLCLNTRMFPRLVSLVLKGPSGCCKSFALRSALQFVPMQAYELFSG